MDKDGMTLQKCRECNGSGKSKYLSCKKCLSGGNCRLHHHTTHDCLAGCWCLKDG